MQQALFPDAVEYDDGESTLSESYMYKSILYTVYALTFAALNFRGFHGSAAIRESFFP